jgi:group I intron endonuclease
VYRITIGGQHIYVGSSTCLSRREYQHLLLLKKGKHGNTYMQNAWNKHQAIVFEVLERCEIDAVIALEQKYLDEVFGQELCMNICSTAGSRLGVPHSDEVRKKMSANSSRHKLTDGHKERLRYKRSPETIEKMRLAQQNKTSEWKEKLSKSGMGHVVSAETRLKISESLKARNKVAA